MEILLAIALFFSVAGNSFPVESTLAADTVSAPLAVPESAEDFFGTIVMEDLIARANSGSSTDPVTTLNVYQESTMTLLFSLWSCNDCPHNLSHLNPDTYLLEAITSNSNSFQSTIEIE
ncbi:MAG: hypothetical protein R2824_02175 [Saprospiraceae bacterium]|nr:hypothetical protein [Lewinella sp.]